MFMKKMKAISMIIALSVVAACVQMPTEKQSVVDQRPQISFRLNGADRDARVFIDGLDAGRVGDYADGRASLRVLPGTHTVKVVLDQKVLLDERAYLADGVVRPFNLNEGN